MTAPLMGFRALQHIQGSKVHFTRALPARYGPPPGFDYPRGGFLPSSPGRFYFAPAALLGFTLRSLLLTKGVRCVSTGTDPHTVCPSGYTLPPKQVGRPRKAAVSGFHPFGESLTNADVISTALAGCSPGFLPSRVWRKKRRSRFRPISSHALRHYSDCSP